MSTTPDNKPKLSVHHVVSAHWDREWYEPYEGFRYRLVRFLDEVLSELDKGRLPCFQMDGQSIPVEDYLEIRPEMETAIREYATQGRFLLGPWYTQPDEFIPSGESLVRNLSEGLRVAARFGTPSRAGFMCDIFGHNSQMPQILRGFGLECAFIWRGTSETAVGPVLRWRSPDGSAVVAYRFGPNMGYCDYPFILRKPNQPAFVFDPAEQVQPYIDYIAKQAARSPKPWPVLLFDGGDHLEIEPQTPELIERVKQDAQTTDMNIRFSTLDAFVQELLAMQDQIDVEVTGELRQPGQLWLDPAKFMETEIVDFQFMIPGVLSSRIPQKQANARCESLLTQWAEPFSLFAAPLGLTYPAPFLGRAWRLLIACHAHDSICGCSIDRTHRQIAERFEQVQDIAARLKRAGLEQIAHNVTGGLTSEKKEENPSQWIVLFNPTAQAIEEPVDLNVTLPDENLTCFAEGFGYERKPGFWLEAPQGERVPYQRLHQDLDQYVMTVVPGKFPHVFKAHDVRVCAPVQIPAYGYTTLAVRQAQDKEPTRHGGASLVTGPASAENEYLALELGTGGRMTLTDKRTGARYEDLLTLEECADIGDGWYHGTAVNDEVFTSAAAPASIACVASGPQRATFRVELDWSVPARFDFLSMQRSPQRTTLRVEHMVTLRAGCPRVEVHTTVRNTATDHRLRVLFPTGAVAETYLADSPFDAVRRAVTLSDEHHGWREVEVETKPQHMWTAMHDTARGLAVISTGLPESAVLDRPGRPIALTLMRGFVKTVATNGEPEGQLLGDLTFDYWIAPLTGEPCPAELSRLGQRLAAGVTQVKVTPETAAKAASTAHTPLPPTHSFLQIQGEVVVTAVKASQDANAPRTVVRLFNPSDAVQTIKLGRPGGLSRAWACDLNETQLEALPLQAEGLVLEVPPRRIVTVMFE